METGDYALKGFEHVCLIERKGSVREINGNLRGRDRARFDRAITRLAESCLYPYVLLEFRPQDFARPIPEAAKPMIAFDEMVRCMHRHRLPIIFMGGCKHHSARRTLGEECIRIMLGHLIEHGKESIRCPTE